MNLNTFVRTVAERYGDKIAIKSAETKLSYAELDRESNRAANAFLRLGVGRGDRVAFLLSNSPEFIIAFFGVVKIGAIAVLLDPKYRLAELTSLFGDCRPRVLLTESPCLESIVSALPRFSHIENVVTFGPEVAGADASFAGLLGDSSPLPPPSEPADDEAAVIAYTSGPAFDPRGVVLTHSSMTTEAEISGEGFVQTDRDIVPVFALPLHHAAGLTIVGLTSLYRGSTLVMMPGLSIPGLLDLIEREKATLFIGVPFVFSLLVSHAEQEGLKNDISSLRLCASGGSPLPVGVSQRFKELYGHHIAQFWGLTEITAHITVQPPDGSGVLGSIGRPLRGCEVEVVDEAGKMLPLECTGEIICRGPLMKGYYNKPEATAEVMKDGWLYTGDIGHIDGDGNIFITGRKKDMIIPKGQNIAPGDIEMTLLQHPSVAEAAVLGMPDDQRGEIVVAVVRMKDRETATEHELKKLCIDGLANFKIPRRFIFVDFPLPSCDGRTDKQALRKLLSLPPLFPAS